MTATTPKQPAHDGGFAGMMIRRPSHWPPVELARYVTNERWINMTPDEREQLRKAVINDEQSPAPAAPDTGKDIGPPVSSRHSTRFKKPRSDEDQQ